MSRLLCVAATLYISINAMGQGTFQGLGDLPGGGFRSYARDISADGNVVVGDSDSDSGVEAFRWTAESGIQGLGDLADGAFQSMAHAVSADGNIIVGYGSTFEGRIRASYWTLSSGMQNLNPPSVGTSQAYGVSSDGSVIVGDGGGWTNDGTGWLHSSQGVNPAFGISADGYVILGRGPARWIKGSQVEGLGGDGGQAWGASSDGSHGHTRSNRQFRGIIV